MVTQQTESDDVQLPRKSYEMTIPSTALHKAQQKEVGKLLDDMCGLTDMNRKYLIRKLHKSKPSEIPPRHLIIFLLE